MREKNHYYKFKTLREANSFIFGIQLVNDSQVVPQKPIKTPWWIHCAGDRIHRKT